MVSDLPLSMPASIADARPRAQQLAASSRQRYTGLCSAASCVQPGVSACIVHSHMRIACSQAGLQLSVPALLQMLLKERASGMYRQAALSDACACSE